MPTTSPSTPVTVLRRELTPCQMPPGRGVLGSPTGGLELLTPDVAAVGRPCEDEYCPTLDDGSIGGV